MSITDYIFYFFMYSFFGWLGESIYCSVGNKRWINRGFLRGPMCPIYGTGALVLLLCIYPLRELTSNYYINEVIIFFVGLTVCDIVEFMTSLIMEKLFNARWWDYSDRRFNIQGRICLTHTLYWGTAACLFAFVIQPIVSEYFINMINPASRKTIVYIVLTVFALDLADTVINALGIRDFSSKFKKLSDDIAAFAVTAYSKVETKVGQFTEDSRAELEENFNSLKQRYEELKTESKNKTNKTKKRLLNAFPYIVDGVKRQEKVIDDLLDDLKNKIKKK